MQRFVRWQNQDQFASTVPFSLKDLLVSELRVVQGLFHEATEDMTQEEASWQPHEDMEPVCWIIEHVTFSMDLFNKSNAGEFVLSHRPKHIRWEQKQNGWNPIWPKPGDTYLPLPELLKKMDRVFESAFEVIERLDEPSLWAVPPFAEAFAEAYPGFLSGLCPAQLLSLQHSHMHHHLRQIYMLLGRLGKGVEKWPYA